MRYDSTPGDVRTADMSHKYSGIDISKWQPPSKMDWATIHHHQELVIIRATYGVKSDWAFDDHWIAAKKQNMLCGAYIFYRQTQGWLEQYEAFKGELDRVGFGENDILPVIDLEWNEKYDGDVDPAKFNDGARKLAEKLVETYGGCILYLAPGFYQTLGMPEWVMQYPWWIAHYGVPKPWCPWKEWIIWQHTGKGKTPGYSGDIDLNWFDEKPPVVDLIPDIEDHEIPDLTEREPYDDVEDPPPLTYDPLEPDEDVYPVRPEQPTTPDAPLAKRGWFQVLLDWLKLWIFSRKD